MNRSDFRRVFLSPWPWSYPLQNLEENPLTFQMLEERQKIASSFISWRL